MKKTLLLLPAIVACAFAAQAKLNVVATLPDFGSLAREIGGDKINLIVLATKLLELKHLIEPRHQASSWPCAPETRFLIDGGAELELSCWLAGFSKTRETRKSRSANPDESRRRKVFAL